MKDTALLYCLKKTKKIFYASLCSHVVFDYYHWRVVILALSMYTNQYQQ